MYDLERHFEIEEVKQQIKNLFKDHDIKTYQQKYILDSMALALSEKEYWNKNHNFFKKTTIEKLEEQISSEEYLNKEE